MRSVRTGPRPPPSPDGNLLDLKVSKFEDHAEIYERQSRAGNLGPPDDIEFYIKSKMLVIVSFDTLPEQLTLLQEGYASALIGQRPYKIGIEVINTLHDLAAGNKVPAVVDTGTDVVDQSNVAQFLKK